MMKKLGIVVITYNISPELLILQIACIKKFCKDEYTIEVIDNSSDPGLAIALRYHALDNGANYYKTFATSQDGSDSHSFAANFAYQRLWDRYEFMIFLDHDCFPVKPFSVEELLDKQAIMAGIGQGARKKYIWPGMLMLANERIDTGMVDFSPNGEFQLDTGGNLYKLIEQYGEDRVVFFNETYHQNAAFTGPQYTFYAMINNEMFLHFVNASNWNRSLRNQERLASLMNIVKGYLDEEKNTDIHKD